MKGQWFFSVLFVVLVIFVSTVCFAAPGKNKGSESTNKQSLETSIRGKERAEQRHQVKEEGALGKAADVSASDGDDEEKEKKGKEGEKKEKNKDKSKESDDSAVNADDDDDDDDEKEKREKQGKEKDKGIKSKDSDDSDAKEDASSVEEPKSRKGKWWEFYKKSDE